MSTQDKRIWLLALGLWLLLNGSDVFTQDRTPYIETFDNGADGWVANRRDPLPVWDGVAYCFGAWFVDPNHAPPGAGYLHMLMFITTNPIWVDRKEYPPNSFIAQHKSRDFTNAKFTVRLRGLFDPPEGMKGGIDKARKNGEVLMGLRGANLVLLVQSEVRRKFVNYALTGQPFRISHEWSQQTVTLTPDPAQWTCLGSRHDLTREYGCADIAEVLKDVNVDLYLILFPLKIVPIGKVDDPHQTRAGEAYPVEQEFLPKGLLMVDTIRIDYPR